MVNGERLVPRHKLQANTFRLHGAQEPIKVIQSRQAEPPRHPFQQRSRGQNAGGQYRSLTTPKTMLAEEILTQGFPGGGVATRPDQISHFGSRDEAAADDRIGIRGALRLFELNLELPGKPFVIIVQQRDPMTLCLLHASIDGAAESHISSQCPNSQSAVLDLTQRRSGCPVRPVDDHDHLDFA
jgi:hypothetical protein